MEEPSSSVEMESSQSESGGKEKGEQGTQISAFDKQLSGNGERNMQSKKRSSDRDDSPVKKVTASRSAEKKPHDTVAHLIRKDTFLHTMLPEGKELSCAATTQELSNTDGEQEVGSIESVNTETKSLAKKPEENSMTRSGLTGPPQRHHSRGKDDKGQYTTSFGPLLMPRRQYSSSPAGHTLSHGQNAPSCMMSESRGNTKKCNTLPSTSIVGRNTSHEKTLSTYLKEIIQEGEERHGNMKAQEISQRSQAHDNKYQQSINQDDARVSSEPGIHRDEEKGRTPDRNPPQIASQRNPVANGKAEKHNSDHLMRRKHPMLHKLLNAEDHHDKKSKDCEGNAAI